MAALATVSAIPRERQTDSDACDGKQLVGKYIAFAAEGGDHECRVIGFSGGKHTVRYDDGTQRKHVLKDKEVGALSTVSGSTIFSSKVAILHASLAKSRPMDMPDSSPANLKPTLFLVDVLRRLILVFSSQYDNRCVPAEEARATLHH